MWNVLHLFFPTMFLFLNPVKFIVMRPFISLQNAILDLPKAYDLRDSLKKHNKKTFPKRIPSRVNELIFHLTASKNMSVYDIAAMHVNQKDWPGIAYHVVIDTDGNIFLCNDLFSQTYHAKDHNFKSIGICCLGNFEESEMPEVQEYSLMLLTWLIATRFHELKPLGHCDTKETLCPGQYYPLVEVKNHYAEGIKYRSIEM